MPNRPGITIRGYVIKPEMRYVRGDLEVLKFSIALKPWSKKEREGYKPAYSGKGFECTAWFNIVCFGKTAESVNEWIEARQFVKCEVNPNGTVKDGYMTPKTYNGKTSYDWIAQSVSLADSETSTQQEPADFVEESNIPF